MELAVGAGDPEATQAVLASLLDYNDAKRGLEPPAERRARERRDNRRPR